MIRLFIFTVVLSGYCVAQKSNELPVIGNYSNICVGSSNDFLLWDSLPENLNNFSIIIFFSGSTSALTENDLERLIEFAENGGGLYLGSENWPLQAESNQVTNRLYNKESYGEFDKQEAQINMGEGNLHLDKKGKIPAGTTTVAFPMDHRLTVEAWVEDQPLILTGKIGKGAIIIDGGYSRFYCDRVDNDSLLLFNAFLDYLIGINN